MLEQDIKNSKSEKIIKLSKLSRAFKIPKWFFINQEFFEEFMELSGLTPKVNNLLKELNRDSPDDEIKYISDKIQRLISFSKMPFSLEEKIINLYKTLLDNPLVAARVCFTRRNDSLNEIAFLNISNETQLINSIKVLYSMKYMFESLKLKLIQNFNFDVEIIIQEMIQPYSSGILYTKNKFTNSESIVIKSCLGLGIPISNNEITGDIYFVKDQKIINKFINEQKYIYVLDRTKTKTIKTDLGKNKKLPKLTLEQIKELEETGKFIEKLFNKPQIITFSYVGNKLVILSSKNMNIKENNKEIIKETEKEIKTETKNDEIIKKLNEIITLLPKNLIDKEEINSLNIKDNLDKIFDAIKKYYKLE